MKLYDASGRIISADPEPSQLIGITRSFSFKLNLGDYQSADFFCSQRAECHPDMAEEVSGDLDQFCQDEVRRAIAEFQRKRQEKKQVQRSEAA